MSSTVQDLLNSNLTVQQGRIIARKQFEVLLDRTQPGWDDKRSKTLDEAKSLLEFYELMRQAIDDYENRAHTLEDNRVFFTEEEPDVDSRTETITFSLVRRDPGAWAQGAPFEGNVHNLRPILREVLTDPSNSGYQQIVTGYWYDNLVRFTCWARTNKTANARAVWLENFMEEYTWWFRAQGVARVLYWGQKPDVVVSINENKWYGRPIDFYIKTERIRVFSEKTLEEIVINLAMNKEL